MKVTLVYPSLSGTGFNISGNDIVFSQIHEGLCMLKAVLARNGFTDVNLIDLRALKGWEDFREKIVSREPDVVGITLMSPDYNDAMKCVDIVRGSLKSVKIVAGGMHATVMTDELLSNVKIDHVISGEGEIAFPCLLGELKKGKTPGKLIKGERPDVNSLPYIDREFFDFLELPYDFFLPLPFATVLAGRGCSYNCSFCSPAGKLMHGSRIRRRSVDSVLGEMTFLRDTYGVKSFQFWDDCFTEDRDWVMDFCARYKKEGFREPFVCQTRADIICDNPGMMKVLKRTGLLMASIGFESGNNRVLKFMNKGTTVKENLRAAGICRRLGIKIWAYHMYGTPTETNKEARDTARMIKKIRPYRSSAGFFTPHPGSTLYAYCRRHGLSLIDHHDDFVRFPEIDKPKIKGVDYNYLKTLARMSKAAPFEVRARIRIERFVMHKKNKPFKKTFLQEVRNNPGVNKMTLLREFRKKKKAVL